MLGGIFFNVVPHTNLKHRPINKMVKYFLYISLSLLVFNLSFAKDVNIEEDFCQTRLGSYQAVGSGKISTSVYKNSSCLPPADNLLYTECNFDDNETECSGDCSWFSSDYPTTSLSPIMVDNCDTTYRDAIAEWGGVGITLSGTVGRVLGELGVTTGASTEEIEDNTIDALEITSLVLGGG